jgi:phage baseplate assembly protein W
MPEKYYTDIDYNLTINSLSRDVSIKYDVNAIAQSIKNIVLTSSNEKIFDSAFGGNVSLLTFESLLPFQLNIIKRTLTGAIQLQESRATVTNIDIRDTNLGYWQIDVTFTPIYDKNLVKTITIPLQ